MTQVQKTPLTIGEKKERIDKLRKHHKALRAGDLFIPKMFYYAKGAKNGLFISFFTNELDKKKDIYTEMVDREYNSEDSERKLYKLKYNPFFAQELEQIPGTDRYLVPVDELEFIENKQVVPLVVDSDEFIDDLPVNQLTARDIAAIVWKKPISNKSVINNLIKNGK